MKLLRSCVSLSLLEILFYSLSRFLSHLKTLRAVVTHFLSALAVSGLLFLSALLGLDGSSTLLALLHVNLETVESGGKRRSHGIASDGAS